MVDLLKMEDLNGLSQEDLQAKIEEANTKFKDLQSNSDRGVQKVIAEKKLSEKALKSIKQIDGDNDKFVELYNDDPELGEYILENVFDWASIDDFTSGSEVKAKPVKEDFEAFYEKKRIEETLEKVSWKLSPEIKEKFDTEFADLTEWKKLTKDSVKKYIKIALKEASPDFSNEELLAKTYSVWGSAPKPKETWPKSDQATKDFMKEMGIVSYSEEE